MTNENLVFADMPQAGIMDGTATVARTKDNGTPPPGVETYAQELYTLLWHIAKDPMSLREIRLSAHSLVRRIQAAQPPPQYRRRWRGKQNGTGAADHAD